MSQVMLELDNVTQSFEKFIALRGLSFNVFEGEILGLIGPNGAGKTTAINAITGAVRPSGGSIVFDGVDILGMRSSRIANLGLVRTFQSTVSFGDRTAGANILSAMLAKSGGLVSAMVGWRRSSVEAAGGDRKWLSTVLDVMDMAEYMDRNASSLPYGVQKRLGVAMALACRPKLILLDEPAAGLNTEETSLLGTFLRRIHELGITILVVEHHMQLIMDICDRIVVMVSGTKIADGTPDAVAADSQVQEAYLGAPDYAIA